MATNKSVIEANKKMQESRTHRQEKRAAAKEKLEALSPNTVIDRYILREGKIVHLRKDEYKKLLAEKAINVIESKPKEVSA